VLNKDLGLSHGKCVKLFQSLFGIEVARSTSVRSILRSARRCARAYGDIRRSVRGSPWVVCDETGWRIDGKNAWLHVFVGPQATCYAIDESRSWQPAKALLGEDYAGVMIHDGWSVYDRFTKARHQQCLAHLIRRCKERLETATRGAVHFPRAVLEVVGEALSLRRRHQGGVLSDDQLAEAGLQQACRLETLCEGRFSNEENRRLAKHVAKRIWSWFWFLLEPDIDATNWRAEQAIRPAVVNRKVWGGNRTPAGAEAQSILTSVLQTLRQTTRDALGFLQQALCAPRPIPLL
jgi:transposase